MAMHLVTGGSGFVGSVIAQRLRARGEAVRVLDLWRAEDLPADVEFVEADITDRSAVERACRGVTYVHHTVALVPLAKAGRRYWTVNVEGTRIALEAARQAGVRLFAHLSSSAVFGSPDTMPITNETPRRPFEAYGEAKKAGEDLVLAAAAAGLPAAVIRPRTVVGTARLGIFQILFEWIRDGADIFIIGRGDGPFQFIQVDDLANVSILFSSCVPGADPRTSVTDSFGRLHACENLFLADASQIPEAPGVNPQGRSWRSPSAPPRPSLPAVPRPGAARPSRVRPRCEGCRPCRLGPALCRAAAAPSVAI